MSVVHFLSYHNAVPIAVSVMLLGAGATFAATNPETIYSETQTVVSIDNTYLVGKDLASYSPQAQIVTVTEDSESYFIEYQLYTIDLEDAAWKDVVRNKVMTVSKAALGEYRDLGTYVTGQLRENIEEESRRLKETQEIERRNVSQKVVATAYGGLVGKMLDSTTETLPGYVPIVVAPQESQVAAAGVPGESASPVPSQSQGGPGAPTIQILGNNPARIAKGSTYADLGAVITGPTPADRALGIHVFVNDKEMQVPEIDASEVGEWEIRYEVTNTSGAKGVAVRTVVVYDPYAAPEPQQATSTPAAPASTTSPVQTENEPAPASTTTPAAASTITATSTAQ